MVRLFIVLLAVLFSFIFTTNVYAVPLEDDGSEEVKHQWEEVEEHVEKVHVDTHDIEYRRNFIKQTRPCEIYYEIRTIVYYCEIHGHTKVETVVKNIEHSENHS